jgi:prepilin peptidase CpaA
MSQLLSHPWPGILATAMILASGVVIVLAACHDVAARTVPNWMSVLIALFGVLAAFAGNRLLISLPLGLAIFLMAAFCWRRGWMGGADVKLLGAIAIVLPPGVVGTFAIAMSAAGAMHAIVYLLARRLVTPPPPLRMHEGRRRPLLLRALRAERWRISRGGPLPYACAIAFGFLFVVCIGAAP